MNSFAFFDEMNQNTRLIAYLVYFIILFPILFYPIGADFAIFLLGGRSVFEGGKIYVDYIDIKPPFVYYFFAFVYSLCGSSQFLIQLCNFALNFAIATLIYEIVVRTTNRGSLALLSSIPYVFLIHAFDYHKLMELESLFNLIFLLILYIIPFAKKIKLKFILIGLLVAVCISLKYVLGIILIAIALVEWEKENVKHSVKKLSILAISSALFSILLFLPVIIDKEIYNGFLRVVDYLAYYYTLVVDKNSNFKYILDSTGTFFGVYFSIFFLILGFIGIWKTLRSYGSFATLESRLHSFLLLSLLLLSISIIIENKFFSYHFLRLFAILSIYIGIGFNEIINELKEIKLWLRKFIIASLVVVFALFSTFPRFVSHSIPIFYHFFDRQKYFNYYDRPGTNFYKLAQEMKIKEFINPQVKQSDTVILVGDVPSIYMYLRNNNFSAFPFAVFYLSPYRIPKEWEKILYDELNNSRFIIVQRNDAFHFYRYKPSTFEALQWKKEYYNVILNRFRIVFETTDFIVYKRID